MNIAMAVNENGYVRPTYDELLEDRVNLAKELFGEDIDTSDASPLGKFIRLAVKDLAEAYEAQEQIYYSRFPNTATGQSLDRLMPFAGVTRSPATRAVHEITFNGTEGAVIETGFLVSTDTGVELYLLNDVTLDSSGSGVGLVECTEDGTVGNVTLGSITQIVNPNTAVSSIDHTNIEELGVEEETDSSLRKRFAEAIAGTGSATLDAIKGAVLRVSGVRSCVVNENDTDTTDSKGVPPHSFEVLVHAPESLNQQVAEAIFSRKPIGIKSHGDISVEVLDASGEAQTVKFSRVADLSVYVKMTVVKDNSFETEGVNQIKTALSEYIGGLEVGGDVVLSHIYKYIFSVTGVTDVTSLTLSTDGTSYSASNIIVDTDNIAVLSAQNVEVTVV